MADSVVKRWDRFRTDHHGRERPSWATAVLSHLADAGLYGGGDGRLTADERDILNAIEYRLRSRLGETQTDGEPLSVLGDALLRRAVRKILGDNG